MKTLKKAIFIVPVIFGIIFFVVLKSNKKPPVRLSDQERVQTVRTISLEKMTVVPRVTAFGYVEADRTWQGISEVSGKVVYVNENLKKGYFIRKGEVLARIDTTNYGLAETRGVADVMNLDAQLKELEQSRKNTQRLLAIEKKALASAALELKRNRELAANQYISESVLEKEERNFLARQTTVNNLQNTLDLIPSQEKALQARKKAGESTVTERKLDIAKTQIRAPFNCRLSAVNIEQDQFAAAGSVLFEAQSVDRAEIPVPLTPKDFFILMPKTEQPGFDQMPDMETIRRAMGIKAKVKLPVDKDRVVEWDGTFSRTSESLDPKTGAVTIYVSVDNPYKDLVLGKRPPLITNMYVEVELRGRAMENQWVVPRSAVHDGKVYICTAENRLEIRPVDLLFHMKDMAVLSNASGFTDGEQLVLADLVPAIEGMKLKPVETATVLDRLIVQARGEKN